ncbi:MAG: ABC transporter permease, partial [bacterium]|nr:ABC transporter permease [bacterium]
WQGKDPNINPLVTYFQVDADFLKTFQIELANGRFFSEESKNQAVVVINERFAQIMGLEAASGNRIYRDDISLDIIGIVKDFHFKPVFEGAIEPIMIFNNPDIRPYRFMYLKIYTEDVPQTIAFIKDVATQFNPNYPFEFHFLDEAYDQMYRWIDRTTNIVRTFAMLAIVISCLGLFGLASFMAEQRTKEIGVRKVLGASTSRIVMLLSREFTRWVLIANIPGGY